VLPQICILDHHRDQDMESFRIAEKINRTTIIDGFVDGFDDGVSLYYSAGLVLLV
jgi:hypothetical protein